MYRFELVLEQSICMNPRFLELQQDRTTFRTLGPLDHILKTHFEKKNSLVTFQMCGTINELLGH